MPSCNELEGHMSNALLYLEMAKRNLLDAYEPLSYPQFPDKKKVLKSLADAHVASCTLDSALSQAKLFQCVITELLKGARTRDAMKGGAK